MFVRATIHPFRNFRNGCSGVAIEVFERKPRVPFAGYDNLLTGSLNLRQLQIVFPGIPPAQMDEFAYRFLR